MRVGIKLAGSFLLVFCSYFLVSLNEANADGDPNGGVDSPKDDLEAGKVQYPGQEFKTNSGKRVKRWSTEGPVTVNQAPPNVLAPQQVPNPNINTAPGVPAAIIIDNRTPSKIPGTRFKE